MDSRGQRAPSSTIALHIAEIHASRAEWAEAEGWYSETLRLQPMSPEAMGGLVRTARAMGEPELAWERTATALVLHPDHAELAVARAEMLLEDGRVEDARVEVEGAMDALASHPWAHLVLAEVLWQQGEADQAIDALHEALRLAPFDLPVRMQLAQWLLEVGRNAEARRTIAPAGRLLPEMVEVQELYAEAQRAVEAELSGSTSGR